VGIDREQEALAEDVPTPLVLTGAEAVVRVERALLGADPARDPAVAEGLALAGVRAASVCAARAVPRASELGVSRASCVHHVVGQPGASATASFELAATSAQEAVDHCIAAHRLSARLGRPGVCSLAPGLAADLALLALPHASLLASRLGVEGEREPDAGPDRVVALAREALAAGRGEGAASDTVFRGGTEGAKVVLVAAGADAAAARSAARAATVAGIPARWLALTLIRPLPVAELRAALAGARYVFALSARRDTAAWLAAALRATANEKAELRAVSAAEAHGLAEALREALGECGFDPSRLTWPARTPLEHRLVVAPDSEWGERTVRRVLASLAQRETLRIGRRARRHRGAIAIGWSDDARAAGSRDLLLAADPAALDAAGSLSLLRPGSAVVLLSDAAEPSALVGELSPEARAVLRERGHRVSWLGLGPGGEGLGLPGEADGAAMQALVDGAMALLTGCASTPAPRALEAEDLATEPPSDEIDFRATPDRLCLPAEVESAEAGNAWASWITRFHRDGAVEGESPAQRPPTPATLALLAEEIRSHPVHPFVLVAEGAEPKLSARSLHDQLGDALAALRSEGREARTLEDNRAPLTDCAARCIARAAPGATLAAALSGLGDAFAERLGLADEGARALEAELEALRETLPAGARAFDLRSDTPVRLYLAVLSAVRAPCEAAFAEELVRLRDGLRDRLKLDRMSSDEGHTPAAISSELGGAATRYLDPDALAETLPKGPGWALLDERRRRCIEETLATIERHLESDAPPAPAIFLRPPGVDLHLPEAAQCEHADPLAAAEGYFDGVARGMAALFGAARRAQLLLADTYRPEVHDEALACLSWESFTAAELALLPAVTVVTTGRHLRERGQGSLSELLRSSRPVRVLVQDDLTATDEALDLSRYHVDLGQLVMAHRETFALSTTLARPDRMVERLVRMLGEPRPGVVLVQLAASAPASWRPLLAEAALRGRACPDFLYDPEAGPSWADRFDVEGNPEPERAWPLQRIPHLDGTDEQTLEVDFTFADAVALEPAYQRHLRAVPRVAWDDDVQLPLAQYLSRLEPGVVVREIPFLWVVDEGGTLQRAVVTRELAVACRDRLRTWRVLQEFGGFENAYAERAAASAREAAEAEAMRERAELVRLHAEELAQAQQAGARESMQRLAAALLNRDPLAAGATAPPAQAVAPVTPEPVAAVTSEPAPGEPAAEGPQEEAEPELSLDEPWIEMILCTSCNDCTNINPRMFQYTSDKQAFIADAGAGTFAELVQAAVKCPAKCIHPGKPRSDDSTATPELIARAAEFN
jgi:ferredoxin